MFFTGIAATLDQFDTLTSADIEEHVRDYHERVITLLRKDPSLTVARLRKTLAGATTA